MPAAGFSAHWKKLIPGSVDAKGLLFERGQKVVTPSGRVAVCTQYWDSPTHEYCGCASLKYEDNGDTTVIKLSLLRAWQPGQTYTAPPRLELTPIPAHFSRPIPNDGENKAANAGREAREAQHIEDDPQYMEKHGRFLELCRQLEEAQAEQSRLQAMPGAEFIGNNTTEQRLVRADKVLAGDFDFPEGNAERLSRMTETIRILSQAKPLAQHEAFVARGEASERYCRAELPFMLDRLRRLLNLLTAIVDLNEEDRAVIGALQVAGYDMRGGLAEVRFHDETMRDVIKELRRDIERVELIVSRNAAPERAAA